MALLFFELGLIGSALGLMIFHKMSLKTHHNYLYQYKRYLSRQDGLILPAWNFLHGSRK